MMTNNGKSGLTLAFAGTMIIPTMMDIGTGSRTITLATSGLVTPAATAFYTTRDISVAREVTYTADFSSITMSGLILTEFGFRTSGGGLGSGTYYSVDSLTPVQYDGSNELQIQVTYQIN